MHGMQQAGQITQQGLQILSPSGRPQRSVCRCGGVHVDVGEHTPDLDSLARFLVLLDMKKQQSDKE